jgi:hypothetical protein
MVKRAWSSIVFWTKVASATYVFHSYGAFTSQVRSAFEDWPHGPLARASSASARSATPRSPGGRAQHVPHLLGARQHRAG